MTYKQMAKQAKDTGELKELQIEVKTKWQKGENIIGMYKGFRTMPSKQNNKEYNMYLFDTDEGLIYTPFGAGVLDFGEINFQEGSVYVVEYVGNKKLQNGREMRDFKIYLVKEADVELVDEDADTCIM